MLAKSSCWTLDFYPRPPRGGRLQAIFTPMSGSIFLSTPSARRATTDGQQPSGGAMISIHALREEGDDGAWGGFYYWKRFLSTPSARRATVALFQGLRVIEISIHALREEGDVVDLLAGHALRQFLSTPSARRATSCRRRSRS